MVTIVITSFNRALLLVRAVESALQFVRHIPGSEIIIVDDASTDNSQLLVDQAHYEGSDPGIVRYFRNPSNLGVAGSKNVGYVRARTKWVAFLDSDDMLIPAHATTFQTVLGAYSDTPIIFFRCLDEAGGFVGRRFSKDQSLDLHTYIRYTSFGEALTVINKQKVMTDPYITELRGYEGLGCTRIIACHGAATLAQVAVRVYSQQSSDRLSCTHGVLRRAQLIAKGHRMMLREFGNHMTLGQRFSFRVKWLAYATAGAVYGRITQSRTSQMRAPV